MSLPAFARLLLCLLLCSAPLVHAQTSDTSTAPLRVGITEVPPFVIADGKGDWEGISIDLWRAIADRQGWEYEWQVMPFSDLLEAVEQGEVDVVVGALTMTSEREAVFDFSHPFYQTGLSIGLPHSPKQGLLQSLKALFSWGFLSVIGALALLLLVLALHSGCWSAGATPSSLAAVTPKGLAPASGGRQ
ncbi:transporter substrate-binding domain-containing protein [Halopseudomonas pachastrellae]|nr:transporter substrate-binding domain-containing protein [Halopseudomonas pachastrellae]